MPVLVRIAVQHDQAMPRRAEDEALARDTRERGTEDALPLLLGGADVGHPPGRPQDLHALLPCWSGCTSTAAGCRRRSAPPAAGESGALCPRRRRVRSA